MSEVNSMSVGLQVAGTTRSRIVYVLRQWVLSGALARGERLDLDDLASRFGTSRTPVREAVRELAHEGLLRVPPRSKPIVVGVTPEDVADNFELMAVLSGLAAQWAAERMTDDDIRRIQVLAKQLDEASGSDVARLNWEFHREINRGSDSPPLFNQLRGVGLRIPQTFFTDIPEQRACSRREHAALVDALTARQPDQAREITERHFLQAGALLASKMKDDESNSAPRIEQNGVSKNDL
ncbi:GntR family transcriptional regulator [Gordonia sp. SCSIO 19800]|uniref:GntR family transcriptional regulator n=1 Tax=Gordonia sp. SCSIO 19800 TaxID=2826926 RepID=UPI001B8197A2|nr:GntR family transcriptional regulator [Gordonia sp. SCSIO 19800]MBR7194621.1 GntR family transcriptional regulator [Gordonia sp. SCSIO 19800]